MASMGGGGQPSSLVDEQGTRGQRASSEDSLGSSSGKHWAAFPGERPGSGSTHGPVGPPTGPQAPPARRGPIGSLLCEPGKGGQGLRARGGPACGFSPAALVQPGDGRV